MSISITAPVPQPYILMKPKGWFLKGSKPWANQDHFILTVVILANASFMFCIIALKQSYPMWQHCLDYPSDLQKGHSIILVDL